MKQRVQKFLASKGHGSRREVERWIHEDRLKINGNKVEIGTFVDGNEIFSLDGKNLYINAKSVKHQHLIYNKDNHEICSRVDPSYNKSVFDALPKIKSMRWIMVGRLDVSTTGLLLFTTDGELANRLMHPSYEIIRQYAVRLYGHPSHEEIAALKRGVTLSDGPAAFLNIKKKTKGMANSWFEVSLSEGRKHEVKRLWQAVGYDVNKLIRIGYGPMLLPKSLKKGKYQSLSKKDVNVLYDSVKLSNKA
jgi:23S rRNA pseudouridine2605 synthase